MKKHSHLDLEDVHTEKLCYEVKKRLEKKGFSVVIIDDIAKIKDLIENLIPDDVLVGLDGSNIINELNIPEYLRRNWNIIVDPFLKDITPELRAYLNNKITSTEYYITIADSVSMDGKIMFNDKNEFLTSKDSKKPENVIAFVGSGQIVNSLEPIRNNSNSTQIILEVSPYGLKRGLIDNYGQMEEYHDLKTGFTEKQNNFTIVLLAEEHVY